MATRATDGTQLLEFALGEHRFAIDIRQVDEIVERESLTPIPGSPPMVAGVMDLRGETTRIIDPTEVLSVDGDGVSDGGDDGDRVIILDLADETDTGWIVESVSQVFDVDPQAVEEDTDNPTINGIIQRDGEFVMWIDPEAVMA